ncbi:hypothetical protein G6F31_012631 [Rhizopus arrhizus]|nr:hypothetical protein G6F31_012631 [Rhizopus arrhizus]
MAQGEIGEQVRRFLQQPHQPLTLGACGKPPGNVIGRCRQQDMAQAHAIGRAEALRVLLEIAAAVLVGGYTVLDRIFQQLLDQHFFIADPPTLGRLQPQPLRLQAQQLAHHQCTRCLGA